MDMVDKINIMVNIEIEKAYRRGFSHGFYAVKEGITKEKVLDWINSDEKFVIGAPGTLLDGQIMCSLEDLTSIHFTN